MYRLSAFLLCSICLAVWLLSGDGSSAQSPSSTPEKPAKVADGTASPIVIERCRIKLMDFAPLAVDHVGILAHVGPQEGDVVKAGDLLASLKDGVVRARQAKARKEASNDIEIRFAKAAAEVAEAELEKAHAANKISPRTVPSVEVERLALSRDKAVLQIEQAQLQFEIAKLSHDEADAELEAYQIVAPFDGVVTRVHKSKGEATRQGDPVIELSSTHRVKVEGYVDVKNLWSVKRGNPVEVVLDIEDMDLDVEKEKFAGRIVFVDVTVQPVTGLVRVWAEVENRDNVLKAGLNARMTIRQPMVDPGKATTVTKTMPKSSD